MDLDKEVRIAYLKMRKFQDDPSRLLPLFESLTQDEIAIMHHFFCEGFQFACREMRKKSD